MEALTRLSQDAETPLPELNELPAYHAARAIRREIPPFELAGERGTVHFRGVYQYPRQPRANVASSLYFHRAIGTGLREACCP